MANKQKAHSTVHGQPFGGITEQVTGAWPRNIDIGRRPDSFFQLLAERLSFLGLSVTEVIETRLIMCLFTVLSFDAAMIFFLYLFLYFLASFMSNSIILIFKKNPKVSEFGNNVQKLILSILAEWFPKVFQLLMFNHTLMVCPSDCDSSRHQLAPTTFCLWFPDWFWQ